MLKMIIIFSNVCERLRMQIQNYCDYLLRIFQSILRTQLSQTQETLINFSDVQQISCKHSSNITTDPLDP